MQLSGQRSSVSRVHGPNDKFGGHEGLVKFITLIVLNFELLSIGNYSNISYLPSNLLRTRRGGFRLYPSL